MGALENELNLLSQAVFGESLEETTDFALLLERLNSGYGPLTLTLSKEHGPERQSLVAHRVEGEDLLLFDPSRSLVSDQDQESGGMVKVPLEQVRAWFDSREALCLLPKKLP